MSRLKLAFATVCFCLAASADDTLVLHYRFDEDLGSKAKDLGPGGNDGKIVEAKYLSECSGRHSMTLALRLRASFWISLTLPLPMWYLAKGRWRLCTTSPRTLMPRVSTKVRSSLSLRR